MELNPGQGTQKSQFSMAMNKTVNSKELFEGAKEIQISHNDDTYRLTITKLGKLILTK
ncbi:hemin uptake protein HemP [Polycladidibacter stylochi]|uniref:hemin uptake protein HemP n=1 Tax=Polycladidibacter stylochi TaxID=1807766 RepID=UPI0009EA9337